jgi:hypothetical protein
LGVLVTLIHFTIPLFHCPGERMTNSGGLNLTW